MRKSIALVALVVLVACEDKKPQATPTPSAVPSGMPSAAPSASAAASASASAAPEASVGSSGNMAHCPTAVDGAATAIKDVPGGVEVTITAKDELGTAAVRGRTKTLLEAAKQQDPTKQHSGSGGGRGLFGHCTIIMHATTLDVADVPGGTKVTVKAKDPKEVDWLRRETRERDANARAEGGKGMGVNRMAHCPSAVTGAATKVVDTKDGVLVTVTAKDADAVKDIRERAKHAVEASKLDAGKPEHKGDGHGGGGLGRCPVVLQDTVVEAKDVEGGSAITVKPEKKDGLAALQKESKERAAIFASDAKPAGSGAVK